MLHKRCRIKPFKNVLFTKMMLASNVHFTSVVVPSNSMTNAALWKKTEVDKYMQDQGSKINIDLLKNIEMLICWCWKINIEILICWFVEIQINKKILILKTINKFNKSTFVEIQIISQKFQKNWQKSIKNLKISAKFNKC